LLSLSLSLSLTKGTQSSCRIHGHQPPIWREIAKLFIAKRIPATCANKMDATISSHRGTTCLEQSGEWKNLSTQTFAISWVTRVFFRIWYVPSRWLLPALI
jgi:hypothetical protein